MNQTFEYFNARAEAALAEAERAVLTNVRERELRSAKAWREMADRALSIAAGREQRAAERQADLAGDAPLQSRL